MLFTATLKGVLNVAEVPTPLKKGVVEPLPAIVDVTPRGVTLLILLKLVSAIKRIPLWSTAIP